MRIAPRLRSGSLILTSTLALAATVAACGGGGNNGSGTAGSGVGGASSVQGGRSGAGGDAGAHGFGGASVGSGGVGTGGQTGTGSGGAIGTGGQSGAGGADGGGGQSGGSTGTGGAIGSGGQSGGASGAAGSGTGFTPYVCPSGVSSPTTIPAGSTATRIAGAPPSDAFNGNGKTFTNVEGPVWIGDALYFSEMLGGSVPPARILKIDESDAVTPFYPPSGAGGDSGSNGLAVDPKGRLVSANHGAGGIVAFDVPTQTKISPPLIDLYNGARFNSPNDLTIRSDGTIYFTDPFDQALANAMGKYPQGNDTWVYMLPPNATTATAIVLNLTNPNGITLSLDERTLFVDDNGHGVMRYAINADGTIGATATVVDQPDLGGQNTDGMAIDCAGDLYVVRVKQHDVIVVGSSGTTIGDITGVPGGGQLTNVAFGGADHKTLYITAQGSGTTARGVFKLPMPVPGMPY